MSTSLRLVSHSVCRQLGNRTMHTSSSIHAISPFAMPAMSPTMTEGGLASWKVKEGDKFAAGDVLLEIETDKATMDVEAQDDGVMAKIVVNDGAKGVAVGKVIAMLAEEGDDISNVEVPADQSGEKERSAKKDSDETTKATESSSPEASSSSKESESSKSERLEPAAEPKHAPKLSKPVMPSVLRLLADFNVSSADAESINGTGVKGRLTKGDVLTFLGKAQGPTGTYKEDKRGISAQGGAAAPKSAEGGPSGGAASTPPKSEPLTGDALRSMILSGLASSSHASRAKEMAAATAPIPIGSRRSAFDELLDDYQFKSASTRPPSSSKSKDFLKGLL